MEKVKLSVELEPELRRRVKLAATSRDQTIREWVLTAIRHELEQDKDEDGWIMPPAGAKPKGLENPPKARSGRLVSDAIIEPDEKHDDIIWAPPGVKPLGSARPPRPRSGRSVADAIIEDREASW